MYVFYGSDIFTFFKEKIHTQKSNKRKCISIIFSSLLSQSKSVCFSPCMKCKNVTKRNANNSDKKMMQYLQYMHSNNLLIIVLTTGGVDIKAENISHINF